MNIFTFHTRLKLTSNIILKTVKFILYLESFICLEVTAPDNQYFFDVTNSFVIHDLIFENCNKYIPQWWSQEIVSYLILFPILSTENLWFVIKRIHCAHSLEEMCWEVIMIDQVCRSCEITIQKQIFDINLISLIFLQSDWDEQP